MDNLPGQNDSVQLEHLCEQAIADGHLVSELLESARPKLTRLVAMRIPQSIARRFDAEDVVQETFTRAIKKFGEFASERRVPVIIWLRGLALDCLVDFQRKHLGAAKRSISREVAVKQLLGETSLQMTSQWVADAKSPSQILSDKQRAEDLQRALEALPEHYREVLVLRFFESLTLAETAAALNASTGNVKILQYRAIKKLESILKENIGWQSEDRGA